MKYLLLTEGKNEKMLLDILLDRGLLIYQRGDLLAEEVFHARQFKTAPEPYSWVKQLDYSMKVQIVRVGDKITDSLAIPKDIKSKIIIPCLDFHIFPEFEMLFIVNEGKYDGYIKSHLGPKEYAKQNIKIRKRPYDASSTWIKRHFEMMADMDITMMFARYGEACGRAHKGKRLVSELIKK